MGTKTRAGLARVPRGLAQLVERSAKHIDGRYCWGLPHYSLESKLRFHLVELGDLDLFEDNEVDLDRYPDWIPFAVIENESQFLAVSTRAPYPVGMWEHENGEIYPVWSSIDDFISKVIDKRDKTPFEVLDKTLDKVSDLVDHDAYADALGIIEPAIAQLPKIGEHTQRDDRLARAYNLRGLSLKGVKRFADARAAFDRAAALGEDYADLNILSLLSDELADPHALIAYALKVREDRYFDDYGRVWVARYLAGAYLDIGEAGKAEAELRKLVDDYAITNADKITDAREGLDKYIAAGRPGAAAARGFLDWFKPKTYEIGPDEATANRAWWKNLPQEMRDKLLEGIDKEDVTSPSDDDIARCKDVDNLYIDDETTFDDVAVFLPLTRLETLSFYGNLDTVEPLRALPALTSLRVNNEVIKNFALPSRADRMLWKAAEDADRKGIARALEMGASLGSRGEHGQTALAMAAGSHDIELCTWLVEQGADPWASDHLDLGSYPIGAFAEEDVERLERAAKKAGIAPPGNEPWCILEADHHAVDNAASFDDPEGLDLELDEGESLAAKWPADVRVQMETPKKDHQLMDLHKLGYRAFIVSDALASVLRGKPGVELLPITILDHAKKPRSERYWVLNPLAVDCLIAEQAFASYNLIDDSKISELAAMPIDPARLGDAKVFRLATHTKHVLVTRDIADAIKGFTGVRFVPPKR